MCMVVSGVVLRTLATRGRKRAGPTSEAPWEGWSEAEGPKGNIPYDHTGDGTGEAEGPKDNTAYDFQPTSYQPSATINRSAASNQQAPATDQPLPPTINKEDDLQVN